MAPKKAMGTVKEDKGALLPAVDNDLEQDKLMGQTDDQQAMREYHEGKFQTHDPITGKKRDEADSVSGKK